jgi:hypothetical protein
MKLLSISTTLSTVCIFIGIPLSQTFPEIKISETTLQRTQIKIPHICNLRVLKKKKKKKKEEEEEEEEEKMSNLQLLKVKKKKKKKKKKESMPMLVSIQYQIPIYNLNEI